MADHEIIRCMLLPLSEHFLLLPNAAVAEVIAYVNPDEIKDQELLLGVIDWRGVKVPIISFERACGLAVSENSSRDRVAIVYHPDGNTDNPYLGVKLIDIPRAFNATQETLVQEASDIGHSLVKFQISYQDNHFYIPDIDELFELV